MRLQRFLASCGVASRRDAEKLIKAGRVTVNGETAQIGATVEPENDEVVFDGQRVAPETHAYILLNKPLDVVTTMRDTHDRQTVIDCLPGIEERVFPVGRLDIDVEGALLLTNDGELAHRLMHPSFEVEKLYSARVRGTMSMDAVTDLAYGVELDDGMTAPALVEVVSKSSKATTLRLTIHEGRNRQVKRMCRAVGHRVINLRRLSFAGLTVQGMDPGQWRRLRKDEIRTLRELAELDS